MLKNIFAKNRRKNLHKHPGPPFQIRPGPGYFSIAHFTDSIFIFFATSKFLISTGVDNTGTYSSARKTEIIDLKNDGLTCKDLGNYPLEMRAGVGSNIGSFTAICGGHDDSSTWNQCYKLVAGEWQQFANMTSERVNAAGKVI